MRMYHHRKSYREPRSHIWTAVAICILVSAGFLGIWKYFHSEQQTVVIDGAAELVTRVAGAQANIIVSEKLFSFELPPDWKEVKRETAPENNYITWAPTLKEAQGRTLTIYVDSIPALFGANRLLPVEVVGNTLVAGQLSDNCADFTDMASPDVSEKAQGYRNSIWQGIRFICDTARKDRNVLVVAALNDGFQVKIKGASGQVHKYVLVYTDHAAHQDFQQFNRIVQSFKVK